MGGTEYTRAPAACAPPRCKDTKIADIFADALMKDGNTPFDYGFEIAEYHNGWLVVVVWGFIIGFYAYIFLLVFLISNPDSTHLPRKLKLVK